MISGGAVAIIGGLFLPWTEFSGPVIGTLSIYESEGDGIIAAIAGALVLTAGVMALNDKQRTASFVLAILGTAGVALVVFYDYPAVADLASESDMTRIGSGMYALIVAVVLSGVGTGGLGAARRLKIPGGADNEALTARTRELMESRGVSWKHAWRMAVEEVVDSPGPSDPGDHMTRESGEGEVE